MILNKIYLFPVQVYLNLLASQPTLPQHRIEFFFERRCILSLYSRFANPDPPLTRYKQ